MSELQFPKDPIVGQEYDFPPYKYYWDGTKWKTKGIGYNPVNDLRNELEPRISTSESRISDTELQISNNKLQISNNESKVFEALRRSYDEAGYHLVTGSFETGGTLTNTNDVLLLTATGVVYSYSGTLPKVVDPSTDPTLDTSYVMRSDAALRVNLSATDSSVSIAGLDASKVRAAATNVRSATVNKGSGTQTVSAAQIGSSLLFTAATAVMMPTLASLGGVTGHYRIMAGANPITLTRIDGLYFTVRGTIVSSITIPAGSDCYVVYDTTSSVYVYRLETHETIIKSYCLVNALGTGAPNELVSTKLPVNLAIKSRYVLDNPFGANTPVICWAEIFVNNKWSQTGFASSVVGCSYVQGEGIIIQTGEEALLGNSSSTGGGHGYTIEKKLVYAVSGTPTTVYYPITSAKCRVFVQKLGA